MNITGKVRAAISGLIFIGILVIGFQTYEICKVDAVIGKSPAVQIVIAVVCVAVMIAAGIIAGMLCRSSIEAHVNALKDYSNKISGGETELEVKAPAEDEFLEVYKSLAEIVAVNRNNAKIAEAIANGDLTIRASIKSDKDLMGNSLASLLKVNNEVLSGIKESSYQLTTGAEQVAAASQALAQGSTEQAASIEEVTVSMKEIENMTKDNADSANNANDIVLSTKKAAELGNERMEQMKIAMDEINGSSEKISKIIKVIDDISFQTNILALNAAVEAARAGSHGKGFAVVAEQIRELAGKSAAAAAETADMIDDSIRKVHNGTKLADETAKALIEIVKDVDSVVSITGSIAKASNEQAAAVSQIDQAIVQVSQVIQNNSATSEECAAAAEELSGQSFALRQMIGRYKLVNSGSDSDDVPQYKPVKAREIKINLDDKTNPEDIISLDGGFGKY